MKQIWLLLVFIISISISCDKKKNKDVNEKGGNQKKATPTLEDDVVKRDKVIYYLDTVSEVRWWAYKNILDQTTGTNGKVGVKYAKMELIGDSLVFAEFTANMNTIYSRDLRGEEEEQKKLISFLKKADFFDTQEYPNAYFELEKASRVSDSTYTISGKLSIKGEEKSLSTMAYITTQAGKAHFVVPKFELNRLDYELQSEKEIDKYILDGFEIEVDVRFKQ